MISATPSDDEPLGPCSKPFALLDHAKAQFIAVGKESADMQTLMSTLNPRKMTTAEVQRIFDRSGQLFGIQLAAVLVLIESIDSIRENLEFLFGDDLPESTQAS